jgi:hypothetical protein
LFAISVVTMTIFIAVGVAFPVDTAPVEPPIVVALVVDAGLASLVYFKMPAFIILCDIYLESFLGRLYL